MYKFEKEISMQYNQNIDLLQVLVTKFSNKIVDFV